MRQWILGVLSASLMSTLALALCPPGRVRTVTRMVCGLVCALAAASPLVRLQTEDMAAGLAAYGQKAQILAENAEEEGKMQERAYIQEQCAAYICAKAAEKGVLIGGAEVQARWDDEALVWVPWSAAVDGGYSRTLSELIEAELGIPARRQEWSDGG